MHIKQIIIQGFKSYKDQTTIDPFSPQHNVVVGRNGSGKSNFFAAIRFVLGDAYQSLSKEERQALLHEGVGAATISAFVEIIFDNADNRFPTGKNEVILRRSIGLTLDEYSLDRKTITKTDVMSLLESAGFSRANPYYIVPQGRINTLTMAKDEDRLKLLKEIAGTRVYEQKRAESNKLMQETQTKRAKIEEVLTYIQDRLLELDGEKTELSEYNELDKDRRSIEYTIYAREQSSANRKLEDLEEDRRRYISNSNSLRESYIKNDDTVQQHNTRLRDIQQNVQLFEAEKKDLQDEREHLMKTRAKLELLVKDLEDSQMSEEEYKATVNTQLQQLENEIAAKQAEVDEITPQYSQLTEAGQRMRTEMRTLQAEQQHIYAKQARSSKFTTKQDRDTWLTSQIQDITNNLTVRQQQLITLEEEKKAAEANIVFKAKTVQELKLKNVARYEQREKLASQGIQLKIDRDEATEARKALWREEARMESVLRNCTDEIRKSERTLANSMDKNTSIGLASINRIVREHGIEGVHGPVFELFQVMQELETAVEVAVGASLFHVVVDTDETASRLLEIMSKERAGRVTFIPLNRVKSRHVEYPQKDDAVPLIGQLQFDSKYQTAMEQVFGGVVLCRTLEVAASYAKSYRLTVVTAEGNRVDGRGAMSGGYIDTKRSRLSAAKSLRTWQKKLEQEQLRGQKIKQEITQLDQKVTSIVSNLQTLEHQKKKIAFNDDSQNLEIKLRKEEDILKNAIASKTRAIDNIRVHGQLLEKQLMAYQNELASEPTELIKSQEDEILKRNSTAIEQISQQLVETAKKRREVEDRINSLRDSLDNELLRKKEELQSKKERVMTHGSVDELMRRKHELKIALKKLVKVNKTIGDLDSQVDKLQEEDIKISSVLEEAIEVQMRITQGISREEKKLEENLLKRSLLSQKKEECNANIRDLGVLPDEAFEKYNNQRIEKLLRRLHRANEKLKKYNHVNKKAYEQYGRFTKQREQLTTRKAELDKSGESISELIDSLDRRKNEAIERTFHDVANHFARVFELLVPVGKGALIMKSSDVEDMEVDGVSIDRYSGISIQVSFNSKSDEGMIMQQLSGGQKSLVALALIFAIQRCDPAPFYLFDEIDANLDAQYRTAVADMIHKMSENAQFITTTFRSELLTNANKFYGVTFQGKVSRIHATTKENALGFVEMVSNK
ncbi:hypothetical protein INT47_004517 [Mucor saturninus]|uniref:Structural maintenance of chromosomes protein n=1 Tax=Mucor saturninus TaxID=64648 RepID=A0A8H7RLH5_9FUNG|nr:hypothetical protein INT47_004517 [Mucor saturninus]